MGRKKKKKLIAGWIEIPKEWLKDIGEIERDVILQQVKKLQASKTA